MIKIDYDVIRENILKLNSNDYLVLKSNAYGFEFKNVLQIAYSVGIRKFCVIDLNDAVFIKIYYPRARVLMLGIFDKNDLLLYEKYQIELSINDLDEIYSLKDFNLDVQIKINSGMNRFGIRPMDIKRCLNLLNETNLNLVGIYSHNATKVSVEINKQLESFYYAIKEVKDLDIHFAASSLINNSIPWQNAKRVGDMIYQNALSFYGKIIKINFLEKGEFVGYDYSYKLNKDSLVGIIDVGYADGLERICNGFLVYINNKYYHLIGKACMNYCFVMIDSNVGLGDVVHFISKYNNMNNYIIFC